MGALTLAILLCDAEFANKSGSVHYAKHGKEFGDITESEYRKLAKEATERKQQKGEVEYKRNDGSKVRYNLSTNVMVIWYPKADMVASMFKPKFDPKTKTVNTKASFEYVRKDMMKNGKKPPF